jgi:hypothetical protein
MSDQGKTLGGAVCSVPLVFFDLIARIVPGMVVLGSILCVVGRVTFPEVLDAMPARVLRIGVGAALLVMTTVFVLSYVLAWLLWYPGYQIASLLPGLGGRWDRYDFLQDDEERKGKDSGTGGQTIRTRLSALKSRAIKRVRRLFPSCLARVEKRKDLLRSFRQDYERLRRTDPGTGERITKLKAQVHMCEVLLCGFILSIGLAFAFSTKDHPWFLNWPLVLCVAGSGIARRYCVDHMIVSVNMNLKLIDDEDKSRRLQVMNPGDWRPKG